MLKIGMVGCGEISLINLKGIQNSGNSKVVLAMDVDIDLANSFAEQARAKPTANFEEVVNSKNIDAVFICTPHYLHAPLGIRAARHGKHVIIEKPLATNLMDAEELISVCKENHVKLSVPYVSRYKRNAKRLKELVNTDAIGKIVSIEIHWISDKPESYWEGGFTGRVKTDWRKSKIKSGGGVLMMNCIHLFDIIDFVTGLKPIKYLSQYDTFLTDVEVEDYFIGILQYNNGAIGSILAGSKMVGGRYPGEQRGVRFFGEYGQIVLSDPDSLLIYTTKNVEKLKLCEWNKIQFSENGDPDKYTRGKNHPRTLFIKEFAEAVFEDRVPPISGEIAYKSLETCIRLYESSTLT